MDLTEEGPPLGTLLEYVIAAKTILKRKRLKAPIQIRKKAGQTLRSWRSQLPM